MKLAKSIALVTGAGRGIGRAIALTLARDGATVILNSRTLKELEEVQEKILKDGGTSEVYVADLTDDDAVKSMMKEIEKRHGHLDILVNNAGIGRFSPVRAMAMQDFDDMWKLNVRAVFHCSSLALAMMEKNNAGIIVNISSLAGKNAFVGGAGYAATKWALLGFSRCLMLEAREYNIRIVTISPGSVDTSFSSRKDESKRRNILAPQDVADSVLLAITMPQRAMVSEIDIRPTRP